MADRLHERRGLRPSRGRGGAGDALVDPSIELVACGSSGSGMPTFGSWEATVLELAGDVVDHLSLHAYYDPAAYETVDDYLACSADLERMIGTVGGIVDAVGDAPRRPPDRAQHRRMERLAPGRASRARGGAGGPRLRARAGAGGGHP